MEKAVLVTKEEVEAAYKETGKHSVKRLLEKMERFEQGKVAKSDLDKALAVLECNVCGTDIGPRGEAGGSKHGICRNCEQKEKERKAEEELKEKWVKLHEELSALDNSYELVKKEYGGSSIVHGKCSIYRDTIFSSGRSVFSRPSGHALRIGTTNYDIKANKLKKDFGAKGLAESLHNKCTELLERIEARKINEEKKEDKEEALIRALYEKAKTLKKDLTIDQIRVRKDNAKVYISDDLEISTYDGESFWLTINKRLPLDQVTKIKEIVES